MDWLTGLFNSGKIVESIGSVVDSLHLSGEEKQQFELELKKLIMQRESELEQTIRQELESRSQIITAEMQHGDRFTRWARPGIVWAGLLFIFFTNVFLPAAAYFSGKEVPKFELDPNFWDAWTIAVSVWAGGRSLEKLGFRSRALNMITGATPEQGQQPAGSQQAKTKPTFDIKG